MSVNGTCVLVDLVPAARTRGAGEAVCVCVRVCVCVCACVEEGWGTLLPNLLLTEAVHDNPN